MQVAIYIRVSTLDQAREGYSLAAQEKTLRAWCDSHSHIVYNVYADEGISGKDIIHRPAMQQMLDDANNRKFNLILVWALSRFTRSVADLYGTLNMLQKHNVAFTSFTESFDTSSAMGRAMVGVCGVFAQLERELTAERVCAAMAERAAQGKRTASYALGYDRDGKDSFRINPAGAEIIHYIFDKYEEFRSLSAVAECCNLRGYRGLRGCLFTAESIRKILTHSVYCSYNAYHNSLYQGIHPAIISVKQYNHVQRLLARNGAGRKCKHPYTEIRLTNL